MQLEKQVVAEFRRGAREGKVVRSRLRESWGFRRDPLRENPPIREVFTDREDASLRLARALGRSSTGEAEVLACVGPLGIGVSALLRVVHESLKSAGATQGILLQGNRFTEEVPPPQEDTEPDEPVQTYFEAALRGADFTKITYVIIDDADEIASYLSGYLDQIRAKSGAYRSPVTVVVGMHIMGWLSIPSETRENLAEQIWLSPLSQNDLTNLVLNRLHWAKGHTDLSPLTERGVKRIAVLSMGVPWAVVALLHAVVRECASRGLDRAPDALVDEVARARGILVLESILQLTATPDPVRGRVLSHLAKNPSGGTSTAVAASLGLNRTTVNYHLSILEGNAAVRKERRGREVFYVPTDAGRVAIELGLTRGLAPEVSLWKSVAA